MGTTQSIARRPGNSGLAPRRSCKQFKRTLLLKKDSSVLPIALDELGAMVAKDKTVVLHSKPVHLNYSLCFTSRICRFYTDKRALKITFDPESKGFPDGHFAHFARVFNPDRASEHVNMATILLPASDKYMDANVTDLLQQALAVAVERHCGTIVFEDIDGVDSRFGAQRLLPLASSCVEKMSRLGSLPDLKRVVFEVKRSSRVSLYRECV